MTYALIKYHLLIHGQKPHPNSTSLFVLRETCPHLRYSGGGHDNQHLWGIWIFLPEYFKHAQRFRKQQS